MTVNPPAAVDSDALSVSRTIRIAAPVEKVWATITEPEHLSRWFGESVLTGREAGATGSLSWDDYGTIPVRIEAVDAPRSITYRWSNDDAARALPPEVDDAVSTVFTFTLESVDGGTQLTVVETGFETTSDPAGNLESHRGGWDSELDELVAYVEGAA